MGGAASAVGGVVGLAGGLLSGSKSADASKGQAEALRAAADKAAAMAQFNPYGMTTAFGTSAFTPEGQGSYTLSPELKAIQDRIFGAAGAYDPTQTGAAAQPLMGGAQSLFNLGQQYLAKSPEQAAQDYMTQQRSLLAPEREAAQARLGTTNFARGTGGLGVNTGTGGAPSNPAAQALYNAQAKQDLQLAAAADEAGMARAKFGAGLFGTGGELLGQVPKLTTAGYAPLEAQLGLLGTTEKMGQQPFLLSQELANNYARAGAQAGQLYMQPQAQAAQAYANYQGYSPMGSALSGAGSAISSLGGMSGGSGWFGDLIGGGSGMGLLNSSTSSQDYMNKIGATSGTQASGSNAYANEWWMK